ncbi:hypothetical protein Tco_1536058, partial [Tanacetum coccineum]
MSKVVEGGRGKKVLVAVAEGRRTTGVEDETAVGLGYDDIIFTYTNWKRIFKKRNKKKAKSKQIQARNGKDK